MKSSLKIAGHKGDIRQKGEFLEETMVMSLQGFSKTSGLERKCLCQAHVRASQTVDQHVLTSVCDLCKNILVKLSVAVSPHVRHTGITNQ